jgi:YD repeat-containing protein
MLKKLLTIITLCTTLTLHATPGATGGAIDVTSLHDIVYEYDKLNRVTKATYASGESIGYSYDAGGNLLGVVFDDPNAVNDKLPVIEEFSVLNPDACFVNNSCEFKVKARKGDNFLDGGYSIDLSGHSSCGSISKSAVLGWGDEDTSVLNETTVLERQPCHILAVLKVYDVKGLYSEKKLTLPTSATESDKDAISDSDEDTFPNDKNEWLDTDGDGISDLDEEKYGLDFLDANDIFLDSDNDGYSNLVEIEAGTDLNINTSTPKKLTTVTVSKLGESLGKEYISLEVDDKYAYILTNDGIKIFDIQNDNDIRLVSFLLLDGLNLNGEKGKIVKQGQYLYVANGRVGFRIIDISNLSDLKIVGVIHHEYNGRAVDVRIQGNYAYVSFNGGNALNIIDITNKQSPKLLLQYSKAGLEQINIQGDYIYADSTYFNGMAILKLDKTKKPTLIGQYEEEGGYFIGQIKVHGNYAYIFVHNIGIRVIDISNKENPKLITTLDINTNDYDVSLELYAQYLFVTSMRNKAVTIIDISNPIDYKVLTNFYDSEESTDIKIKGNKLYVIGKLEGLKIFTTTPKLFGTDDSDNDGYNDDGVSNIDEVKGGSNPNEISSPSITTQPTINEFKITNIGECAISRNCSFSTSITKTTNDLWYYQIILSYPEKSYDDECWSTDFTQTDLDNGTYPLVEMETIEGAGCQTTAKLKVCDTSELCNEKSIELPIFIDNEDEIDTDENKDDNVFILEEFNLKTQYGKAHGIKFMEESNRGSTRTLGTFTRKNESRIEYSYDDGFPREGTEGGVRHFFGTKLKHTFTLNSKALVIPLPPSQFPHQRKTINQIPQILTIKKSLIKLTRLLGDVGYFLLKTPLNRNN